MFLFGVILTKILSKYCKEVILKVNIFVLLLNQELRITQDHSRVPMITQENPWPLMSTVKYGNKALWVVWAPMCYIHECLSALKSAVHAMVPCSWVLMVAYKGSWVLKSDNGPSLVLLSANGAMAQNSWMQMCMHDHTYVTMSTLEHGPMAPTVIMSSNGHSWA